ncbi:unnamed protein product [Rotaria sp. Silwood2]|nr:unnamed protein product [Rotaria sp. Silwood2]
MYNSVGFIDSYKNDLSKALDYYHLALEMNTKRFPIDDLEDVNIYNNIAMIYFKQCNYFEAIRLHHKCLDIQLNATTLLRDREIMVGSYWNLALAYSKSEQNSEALDYFQVALAIEENIFSFRSSISQETSSNDKYYKNCL